MLGTDRSPAVSIDWTKVERVSSTTATLQVVVNPPLRRGSSIHDQAFAALRELHADYVRYVPWLPYPKLAVAELDPPTEDRTFWNFSLIDPITVDFLEATEGREAVLNFSTIPQWMFKTDKPVAYPDNPDEVTWSYERGTELRDPSLKEISEYYARLVSWYARGGFTDERGQRHESGHHYKIEYWEVLNEPEYEHQISPELYTRIYDAAVNSVRQVSPGTKFVGMSLATPTKSPAFFEYFLDAKNHAPGIPLDAISYHFYAVPSADQPFAAQPYTFFSQADGFLDVVRYIERIRLRLSPQTKTMINEVGSITADDLRQAEPGHRMQAIPDAYWNLSAALYAYLYSELARLGIDVVGQSQLTGYPGQFPSVSMLDWRSGEPNARYWVLKLLRENFGPGDKLIATSSPLPSVHVQAFTTPQGRRRVLLVNKRETVSTVRLPGAIGGTIQQLDCPMGPPGERTVSSDVVSLPPFAVAVVRLRE